MADDSVFEVYNKYSRAMYALHKMERNLLSLLLAGSGADSSTLQQAVKTYASTVARTTTARHRIMDAYPQLSAGGGLEHPHPSSRV